MAHNFPQPPPLSGRPPYATDEPDSVYANSPSTRTRRTPQPQSQNRPTSAYDVYDNYLNDKNARQSGYGDLGVGLLNGDVDDDSDDETIAYHGDIKKDSEEKIPPSPSVPAVPIMAPKPGYAAPIGALTMPEPVASPVGQQRSQQMRRQPQTHQHNGPPVSIPSVPSTPHPLQPPMTPITPAFARPPPPKIESGVKFDSESIMRSQKEDLPLARRGQRGDDFWRRFSMVAKEESGRKSTSSWLEKTQKGAASMSRMVCIIGFLILVIIGGAIGFGLYASRNSNSETRAKALGGSEGQGADLTIAPSSHGGGEATSIPGVRPTLTVDKRFAMPEPTPDLMHVVHAQVDPHHTPSNLSNRRRRTSKRRLP